MHFTTTTVVTLLAGLTTAFPLEAHNTTAPAFPLKAHKTTAPTFPLEAHETTAPAVIAQRSQTGRMTYYTPGLGTCGVTNTEQDLVVAISQGMFGTYANPNTSPMCAKSVSIQCNGKTIKAAIKDKCMSCSDADIDVSPAVFTQCADLSVGVITVTWDVV